MEPLGECSRALGGKKDRPLGLFLEGPEKISHPKSHSKISNLLTTELFYVHIFNTNNVYLHTRSFKRIHISVFKYRLTKNGFSGTKRFRGFRETNLWGDLLVLKDCYVRALCRYMANFPRSVLLMSRKLTWENLDIQTHIKGTHNSMRPLHPSSILNFVCIDLSGFLRNLICKIYLPWPKSRKVLHFQDYSMVLVHASKSGLVGSRCGIFFAKIPLKFRGRLLCCLRIITNLPLSMSIGGVELLINKAFCCFLRLFVWVNNNLVRFAPTF